MPNPISRVFRTTLICIAAATLLSAISLASSGTTGEIPPKADTFFAIPLREHPENSFLKQAPEMP